MDNQNLGESLKDQPKQPLGYPFLEAMQELIAEFRCDEKIHGCRNTRLLPTDEPHCLLVLLDDQAPEAEPYTNSTFVLFETEPGGLISATLFKTPERIDYESFPNLEHAIEYPPVDYDPLSDETAWIICILTFAADDRYDLLPS